MSFRERWFLPGHDYSSWELKVKVIRQDEVLDLRLGPTDRVSKDGGDVGLTSNLYRRQFVFSCI